MDILAVAIIVIILSWVIHSVFWAFIFFILGCLAVAAYRSAKSNRRL